MQLADTRMRFVYQKEQLDSLVMSNRDHFGSILKLCVRPTLVRFLYFVFGKSQYETAIDATRKHVMCPLDVHIRPQHASELPQAVYQLAFLCVECKS